MTDVDGEISCQQPVTYEIDFNIFLRGVGSQKHRARHHGTVGSFRAWLFAARIQFVDKTVLMLVKMNLDL
jgi:hypothetical protein